MCLEYFVKNFIFKLFQYYSEIKERLNLSERLSIKILMKKRGIVFSSSEYSDSDVMQVIPQAKNPNNKANLQSDSASYYYDDYSDSSDQKVTVKQTKPPLRPQVNRNKQDFNNHNQNQNFNQNKRDTDESNIKTQKSTGSLNPRAVNRPVRPMPRSIHTPAQSRAPQNNQQQPQTPSIQKEADKPNSKSAPSFDNLPKSSSNIDNENLDDKKSQNNQEKNINEIDTKIHSSPREMKARQSHRTEFNDLSSDDDAVIQTPIENDDFLNMNVNTKTVRETTKKSNPIQNQDYVTYSVKRTPKRSVHGKSYIFSLIKEGKPVLFSKSNSRHPKGVLPISTNSDVHIRKSSSSEYTITAENGCTKFIFKSSNQNPILTYSISPSQNEYVKLPHLNIAVDESFDFSPKQMTSKRPQMSKRGFFFLDFHNKFTLPSEKNAIFIPANPEIGKDDLFVVRKIEKDRIEIDVNINAEDIIVFAIGLSTFLAKYN